MSKKVLIALPETFLDQVDFIAASEHRTRSDLIREALRRYMGQFNLQGAPNLTAGVSDLMPGAPPVVQ